MNILDEILETRKETLKSFLKEYKIPESFSREMHSLIQNIKNSNKTPIISEIKFASPSKGKISISKKIEDVAKKMERGGVVGISVLTEPNYFNGSFEFLKEARNSTSIPILLKDFIFDTKQVYYGKELGADVILLIVKMLSKKSLQELYNLASSLGLESLVEIHDLADLNKIQGIEPEIIGINNRNLTTLKVDLKTTIDLIPEVRKKFPDILVISESGIYTKSDIEGLRKAGADAFLIGSSLMESPDIEFKLKELMG